MKKTWLMLLLSANFYVVSAQNLPIGEDFTTYTKSTNEQLADASSRKDRKESLKLISEWLDTYYLQKPAVQQDFKGYLPNKFYNAACYYALEGRTTEALANFEKAVEVGYLNYKNACDDSDFNTIKAHPRFITALQQLRDKGDYRSILKNAGQYRKNAYPKLAHFTYQRAEAPILVAFKERFNLDSISGQGDDLSKIKNLMHWVHNLIRHDGSASNPATKNASDLIDTCLKQNRGLNCRMLATILKDAYQAMGFESRAITCMPKDTADFDCHVINIVWCKSLSKWLWMDPTNNAYVSDQNSNLLSIEEVREHLITGLPLILNEDANWNNQQKQTKEGYLDNYMSKNLYWLQTTIKSEWDLETVKTGKPIIEYVNLYPGQFSTMANQPKTVYERAVMYATGDPEYFWQRP